MTSCFLLLILLGVIFVMVVSMSTGKKTSTEEPFDFKTEPDNYWQGDYLSDPPQSYYWSSVLPPGIFDKQQNFRGFQTNGLSWHLRPGIKRQGYPRNTWYSSSGSYYLMNNDGQRDVNGASTQNGGGVVDWY